VSGEIADAESVHSLNLKRLASVRRVATIEEIRQAVAFDPPAGPVRITRHGGDGSLEKLVLAPEAGIQLPALLYGPGGRHAAKPDGVILAYGSGKSAAHGDAQSLAAAGNLVLALDLRGLGETRPGTINYDSGWTRWFGDYESSQTAMLTGKPLATMRAEDIARAVDWLHPQVASIRVVGRDGAAIPALLAASFDPRIARVRLERMLVSWESILRDRIHRQQWENAIPAALRSFDLPDLIQKLGPRAEVVDPVNGRGERVW
jgi:hypothetical protein